MSPRARGQHLFFATREDLRPGLELIESQWELESLYRAFARMVVRGFHKVHSYWVGPEAHREFRAGRRLATIGVTSPPEYDLAEAR